MATRRVLGIGLLVGVGVVAWQLALRILIDGERMDPAAIWAPLLVELAWVSGLALLAAAVVILPARGLAPLGSAALIALTFGVLLAIRIELAQLFADPAAARQPFLCAGGSASSESPASWRDALLLQPIVMPLALAALSWRMLLHRVRVLSPRTAVACAGVIALAGIHLLDEQSARQDAQLAALGSGPCAHGERRTFHVSAIPLELTLNRFGDHDPNAFMYVLDERIDEVRGQEASKQVSPGLRTDAIQPLVLRANVGECLEIFFTNRLEQEPAALHLHGLPHQGDADKTVAPGETLAYRFAIPDRPTSEGTYYLHDHGGAGEERIEHGLFGAVIVEPAGSRHLHPETGEPLAENNWEAIIAPPDAPAFREFVLFFHTVGEPDGTSLRDAEGRQMRDVYHRAELVLPAGRAINYRAEPRRDRLLLAGGKRAPWKPDDRHLAATPAPRSYVGEPTKMRVLHGGAGVSHEVAFHPHGGQMREANEEPGGHGAMVDPGAPLDLHLDCSGDAGCLPTADEFVFRCDVPDHVIGGEWATWHVFGTMQADLALLPGRTPLPDRETFETLIGAHVYGKALVPRNALVDTESQRALEDWFRMLPPPRLRSVLDL